MWYWHQVWSGVFVIGVFGNIAAGILGFVAGLLVAHHLYDLREIHKVIQHHIRVHGGSLPERYTTLGLAR